MGTQIPVETVVNQNTPPENIPTPPVVVDPPAPSNQPSNYDSRFDRIEQELAESRRTNARLLEIMDKANAPKPVNIPTPDVNEFFKDPGKHIKQIIDDRLDATIKPLQQFTEQFNQERAYTAIKQAIRNQYGDRFTSVEGMVDQIISQNKGPLTTEVVYGAFSMAYGNSLINPQANNQSRQPVVPNNVVPPNHVPSSPPPVNTPSQQARQLTETEKVVFQMYKRTRPNATEKEWIELMEGGVQGASANMTVRDKVVAPNA